VRPIGGEDLGRRTLTLMLAIAAVLALGSPSVAQALAPVGPGVVGLWQGEGDATDPFNGHDGTLLGEMGFAPASSGQAFSFTKEQQAVDIPDDAALYPSGSFTIAGWVRTSQEVGTQTLIGHYECGLFCPTNLANSALGLFVDEGKAEGWIRDADAGGPSEENGQFLPGSTTVADGADHYLAFERDSGAEELRLYVDGALEASAAVKEVGSGPLESLDGEADDLYLGSFRRCNQGGSGCDGALVNQLSGLLDDAIYWERVVSAGEIAAIHAAGPNGLTTDSTAPASGATAPAIASVGAIAVGFTASDSAGPAPHVHDPSGVSSVDLYVKGPGEPGFTRAASVSGSTQGGFSYTASAPGTYAFATVATDAAGNVEAMPPSPDATTAVTVTPSQRIPQVKDFVTAVFQPPNLYLRLKCPARFKPGCVGKAVAVTGKDRCITHAGKRSCKRGKPMSGMVSANQKPNKWKLVKLVVKPQYTARVSEMAKRPDEKLLTVRQSIHSKRFKHGSPQVVFHTYRVRAATSP
jgi:concanavalin A-like lectin/glucanase superfamily protein